MARKLTIDELEFFLRQSISSDYTREIAENIFEDVKEDLELSADEDFNEDDLRLSIGRALISIQELLIVAQNEAMEAQQEAMEAQAKLKKYEGVTNGD